MKTKFGINDGCSNFLLFVKVTRNTGIEIHLKYIYNLSAYLLQAGFFMYTGEKTIFLPKTILMWWIYALLSALFAALTAIFAKKGISHIDSDLATAIRTFFILLLTWSIALFKGNIQESMHSLSKQNWWFLMLSAAATGLSWLFYFKALQIGKVSQVAPVDKASVAIAIILSVIFLGETVTLKIALGASLIIIGTLVLII